MTRFASHALAAVVAVVITATSFATVTTVPAQPVIAASGTMVLA